MKRKKQRSSIYLGTGQYLSAFEKEVKEDKMVGRLWFALVFTGTLLVFLILVGVAEGYAVVEIPQIGGGNRGLLLFGLGVFLAFILLVLINLMRARVADIKETYLNTDL